jgi:hypothetical protein
VRVERQRGHQRPPAEPGQPLPDDGRVLVEERAEEVAIGLQ